MKSGKLYLIGAGPGDPELLTLKAVRALGEADVVLIDDLVDRAVLNHVRSATRVIAVGKRGGCVSTPQSFIEQLIVREARAGYVVARVKGGDPFVFGRGGEELSVARAAGVAVEVIQGITSGIAAPARLGIPVTHRHAGRGVAFITGHTENDPPDWQALVASRLTLVIYMGVANAGQIQDALTAAGMCASIPVAVIQNATLPTERAVTLTLGTLAATVHRLGIGSPAIIVVGEVVRLADDVIQPATRAAIESAIASSNASVSPRLGSSAI